MKKINFQVEDDLFKAFKKHCIDYNTSMTTKLVELMEKEISNDPNIHYLPVRYKINNIEK